MIIDFHTHVFPDKVAAKALPKLAAGSGGMEPVYDATVDGLESFLSKNGIDKAVALNISTNTHQQKSVNDFAVSLLKSDRIIPFGSVHPDSPDVFDELERLKAAGIKGIKLHPDYQGFFVDEKRMLPIYKKISELDIFCGKKFMMFSAAPIFILIPRFHRAKCLRDTQKKLSTNILPIGFCSAVICLGVLMLMKLTLLKVLD